MPTFRVVLKDKANAGFPPIYQAAFCLAKAKALRCDRIRVERLNGALVSEFTLDKVEQFIRHYRLVPQPNRDLRRDQGDYEFHRPLFAVGTTAPKETP